jgi:hypothetical protein
MLYSYIFKYNFTMLLQSGLYIDFFIKKLGEVFVKNFLVYTSNYFGEKYFIEVLTKKLIDNLVFKKNKIFGWTNLHFFNFFYIMVLLMLYLIVVTNFIAFFL